MIQHGCGQGWASATFNSWAAGQSVDVQVTSVTNLDSSEKCDNKYFLDDDLN